jgi:hypothetical protein
VNPEIQYPPALHQGWNVINGTIWAVGAFGLDRHDRGAHKAIDTFQRIQSKACRPNGIIAERSGPCKITQTYETFLEAIQGLPGLTVRRPITAVLSSPHDTREIGGLTLQVLLADAAPTQGNCAYRVNDSSVVLKVTHGATRVLLTGDIMAKARSAPASDPPEHSEGRLLNREAGSPGLLRADLLKVPHHGSETSSSDAFIAAVAPRMAVVSSAVTSAYQLPDASVVARYTHRGIQVFQTNRGPKEQDFSEPQFGNDHIVCLSTGAVQSLNCAYRPN